ncbi:MAG: glycosyltransferase family 2 protein [Candidatus Eremiobacteraeota bacterium]|nr:glycosyltransferase family 2 protein [Candidatus Eremiobacteraeota bacterium]
MTPEISVVIATKDRADSLARALTSLAAQEASPSYEVVVVDNGSRDATAELVRARTLQAPHAVLYRFLAEPNRGAARNAGIAAATGRLVVFVDDDVVLPPMFLAAHVAAHARIAAPAAVSGPILNVPADDVRPAPSLANYSGAFFCTCNVSTPRAALAAAGNFDERFNLYGWEDTELGLRLRRGGVRRVFAWPAYLYHIKPPGLETLDVVLQKTVERARMAARLVRKDGGLRTKFATGAYALNLWRSALLAPAWSLDRYRALAANERAPAILRALARGQFLDGAYRTALRRALENEAP